MSLDFQALFEATPGLYLVVTPEQSDYRIVAVNEAYLQATKTQRASIIGQKMFEIFTDDPDDPTSTGVRNLRESFDRVRDRRVADTMAVQRYSIRKPDQEGGGYEVRHWSPFNTPLLGPSGEVVHIIHRVQDVTEFVRLKELGTQQSLQAAELRDRAEAMEADVFQRAQEVQEANRRLRAANEQLATLDRAKTEFFGNISHEFRTPLTLMLGPLEEAIAAAGSTADRERLGMVHRNALRLLRLVNSLLDFTRVESGSVRASFEPIALATLTADLAASFRGATDQVGLALIVDCPTLDQPTYVDREMWEKIVLNLVSNAFKHTFEGSIEVRLQSLADRIELSVSDTGVGIPAAELEHIFDRFHRVKGARSRTHEGSGIGLSLVDQLVRAHGGSIRVESREGAGSRFVVSIPTGSAHLPSAQVHAVSRSAAALDSSAYLVESMPVGVASTPRDDMSDAPRILWADDNADMRAYVQRILSEHYRVTSVGDGAEALRAALEDPPDLVLSDVMMPVMDGFELLRRLRAHPSTHTLPVILLSARAGEEAAIEGIEASADDYLVKPFSSRELLARVRTHLEMARARRRLGDELVTTNQDLVRANRAKSDFLSMMSHELRTPLNAVIGFSEVLIDQKFGALNERQERYARNIHDGGTHLLLLVNDLLDISKIEAGRLELTRSTCSARELVEDAIATLRELAGQESVSLELSPVDEHLPAVSVDPLRMTQVLYNLISNAIRFTPAGGRVWVELAELREERLVRLAVHDTGPGIAPADLDRLFRRFSQLDNAKVDPRAGTGLGLALTRQLVELMSGRVGVVSPAGSGACFFIELPTWRGDS